MGMRLRLALWTSITVFVLQPVPATASCGFGPLWREIENANIAVVFSGTVVGIEVAPAGDILTFKVDTVWKGNVSPLMLLYQWNGQVAAQNPPNPARPLPHSGFPTLRGSRSGIGPAIEGFRRFELTRRYVVTAHRLTEEKRALFKVDSKGNYLSVSPCGGRLFDEAQAIGELDRIGPGRAPR
jgi:hypothetical protein